MDYVLVTLNVNEDDDVKIKIYIFRDYTQERRSTRCSPVTPQVCGEVTA